MSSEGHFIKDWDKLPRQWQLCLYYYIKEGFKSKAAAYRKAYPEVDQDPYNVNVRMAAHRLFEKPEFKRVIEEAQKAAGVTNEFLLDYLAGVATFTIEDFVEWIPAVEEVYNENLGIYEEKPILDSEGEQIYHPRFSLWKAKKTGAIKFVRGVKQTKYGLEPQLMDKDQALINLLKLRGLTKAEIDDPAFSVLMTLDEWKEERERRLTEAEDTLSQFEKAKLDDLTEL